MINPQNGHILCGPKSARGVFIARIFPSDAASEVPKVRRWMRKGRKTDLLSRVFDSFTITHRWAAILCKIAQFAKELTFRPADGGPNLWFNRNRK